MPKYRVLQVSFIDNHLRQVDEVIDYDGLPSGNLEPMCDIGRARAVEAKESSRRLAEKILREHQASVVDSSVIADAVSAGVVKAMNAASQEQRRGRADPRA